MVVQGTVRLPQPLPFQDLNSAFEVSTEDHHLPQESLPSVTLIAERITSILR